MKYQTNANFVKPDFIGCVERMPESLSTIREKIGLSAIQKNTNENTRHSSNLIQDAYHDDLINQVIRIYRDDFSIFGYSTNFSEVMKPPNIPQ